jgi:DNA polymerase V
VFRPSLQGRPVIVLSNNDGCAIARSNEAKDLGIKMGAPWFQIRHLEKTEGLVALSANFTLYGDMSDRMMTLAAGLGPTQEIYSIDESFIGLHGVRGDLNRRAHLIRERILRWTGIPCGIGIAKTKTLAKLANFIAKTAERKPGSYPEHLARVCNLAVLNECELEATLQATDVGAVWGVGPRIATQLREGGIKTVLDLARMDTAAVRRRWSVTLERTVREVQGMPCIDLDDEPSPKQQIACTRSFGRPVTELAPLMEAVSEFASRAAEKLRKQGRLAGELLVFMHTSPHRTGPQLSRSVTVPLRRPTSDSRQLAKAAADGMRFMYVPGFQLIKAGVFLMDLQLASVQQGELELEPEAGRDRARLMSAMDVLNARFGKGTLHVASTGQEGTTRTWGMRQERRTPQYTTRWADVPVARA